MVTLKPAKPRYQPKGKDKQAEYAPEWKEIEDVCVRAAASLASCRRYGYAAQMMEIAERAKMRQPVKRS